jgi:hypothetical protein
MHRQPYRGGSGQAAGIRGEEETLSAPEWEEETVSAPGCSGAS